MVTSRAGSRSRPATALAATGSGGETTAPSTAATAHGRPNSWATTVTRAAVPIVRPTARVRIGRAAARSSLIEVACVAANSSGGSTSGRISSGGRSGAGTPGRKPRMIPYTVSSTGWGTPTRSATGVRTTTPRTSRPISTTASTAPILGPTTPDGHPHTQPGPLRISPSVAGGITGTNPQLAVLSNGEPFGLLDEPR